MAGGITPLRGITGIPGISGTSSGGGVTPYNPVTDPNLIVWLDPTAGVSLSTLKVESWTDQKSGIVFAKTSDAARPDYVASGIGGKPSLDFLTNRFLAVASPLLAGLAEMTIIQVSQPKADSQTNGGTVVGVCGALCIGRTDTAGGACLYGPAAGALTDESSAVTYNANSTWVGAVGTNRLPFGYYAADTFVFGMRTGAGGTALKRGASTLTVNLTNTYTTATDMSPLGRGVTDTSCVLGGYKNGAASYVNGDNESVGDIMIFNKSLSDSEYASVVTYLEAKYGIQSQRLANWVVEGGQSNQLATGTDTASPDYPASYANNYTDAVICLTGLYFNYLKTSTSQSGSGTKFGPEIPMSRGLQAATLMPTVVTKYALGGTNLAVDWKPTPTYGAQYTILRGYMDTTIAYAAGNGYTLVLAAFYWLQGEADANTQIYADAYQVNLTSLINDIRNSYGNFTFIAAQISKDGPGTYKTTVRAATLAACAALPKAYVINTDNMILTDGLHFDTASIIAIGNAYVTSYLTQSNVTA